MRVLILYRSFTEKRKTIEDHLYSFKNYVKDVDFFYCDVYSRVPFFLKWIKWDGVILHYTLLAERFDREVWTVPFKGLHDTLGKLTGYKVAIPQDEFLSSHELCDLFKSTGIQTVFTCAKPIDYETLYPLSRSGLRHRITTLTGFVDEDTLEIVKRLSSEIKVRDIDIGYRARNLPYWVGKHGQIKGEVGATALKTPNLKNLNLDISTKASDVFFGEDWYRFLLRSRTTIGCLGGSSLHDPDGSIRNKVDAFVKQHPKASFDEVEKNCFPGQDHTLHLFALSPRHFECAMTKTCQILVEGDYGPVLQPNIHYIELKEDFSNFPEVFEKVADKKLCEEIAERAYRDIVASEKYTYRQFAEQVVDHIKQNKVSETQPNPMMETSMRAFLKLHGEYRTLQKIYFKFRHYYRVLKRKTKKIICSNYVLRKETF